MSALGNLIPLIVLFVVVGGGAYIGYQIYLWSNEMTDRGKKHMEKKNMSFTKDGGLKVGVKDVGSEAYEDKTQKYASFTLAATMRIVLTDITLTACS